MIDVKMEGNVFFIGESPENSVGTLKIRFVDESIFEITSVYVNKDMRGQGIALELVRKAASYARESCLKVIPVCPYAVKVMARSKEYEDVIYYK
jgi:uncharacterized protein